MDNPIWLIKMFWDLVEEFGILGKSGHVGQNGLIMIVETLARQCHDPLKAKPVQLEGYNLYPKVKGHSEIIEK